MTIISTTPTTNVATQPETPAAILPPVIGHLSEVLANVPPEHREAMANLDEMAGAVMRASANGDAASAATLARATRQFADQLADQSGNGDTCCSLYEAISAFVGWIESINNLMGMQANWAADIAKASAAYSNMQSSMLRQAQTGDPWYDDSHKGPDGQDWTGKGHKASDHIGSNFAGYDPDPTKHFYCPGIDNIPAQNDSASYWQTVANQNYQNIQITWQAWVTETQNWAQNESDHVNNISQTTQGDYQNISSFIQIWSNLAALLR
jgi:hypothetical protein